jgi:hypothetical protein
MNCNIQLVPQSNPAQEQNEEGINCFIVENNRVAIGNITVLLFPLARRFCLVKFKVWRWIQSHTVFSISGDFRCPVDHVTDVICFPCTDAGLQPGNSRSDPASRNSNQSWTNDVDDPSQLDAVTKECIDFMKYFVSKIVDPALVYRPSSVDSAARYVIFRPVTVPCANP